MKTLRLLLVLAFVTTTTLFAQDSGTKSYSGPKEKLHIYLLIGQSNMAGRAPFTGEEAKPIDRCYLLNGKDQWEPAKNPLNIYSTIRKGAGMQKMNPGYQFSKTILEKQPGISLGLVVNAKGGTKIEQWKKGTPFYNQAVQRTQAAQKTGVLKGILWHQGESNSGNPAGYLEKLKQLVSDLRSDLGVKDLPFIAGQIRQMDSTKDINQQLAELPTKVPFTGTASGDDLKTQDKWHFDSKSMKLLGQRYAEEMLKIQKK